MENNLKNSLNGRKILFATVPADGHTNPLTGLAKYLQTEANCDVRWYTSENYEEKMSKIGIPHFPFVKALNITAENLEELLPDRKNHTDAIAKLNFDMINFFAKRGPEYHEDLQAIHSIFPFDLLICDSTFSAIPFVKYSMNIPVIAVGIIPLNQRSEGLAPYGAGLVPASNKEQADSYKKMQEEFDLALLESTTFYHKLLNDQDINVEKLPFMESLINESDAYLQIGSHGMDYPRDNIRDNITYLGALMPYKNPQKDVQKWYDDRIHKFKKIVLVTQGTVERDVEKIIVPTLKAFSGTDVLVIATTGGSDIDILRERFPQNNIIIENFIPFEDVMQFVDVYVTNGGYGGTMLGFKNKLPMVAAGVHEGKNEICARIEYLGYGINLKTETPTADEVQDAVNKVLADKKYKQNVTNLFAEMSKYFPEGIALKKIADVLENTDKKINALSENFNS